MLHQFFRKVRWPLLGGAAAALTLGAAGSASNGQNFILGVTTNAATATTGLSAPLGGPALQVTNTNTGSGATALRLTVASGKPPLTTNSAAKVANLNADLLDGLNSTSFYRPGQPLDVVSTSTATNFHAVSGKLTGASGVGSAALYGENDGPTTAANKYGVAGRGVSAVGVYGSSAEGVGVLALNQSSTQNSALVAKSFGSTGNGVFAVSSAETYPAVVGLSSAIDGIGTYGEATREDAAGVQGIGLNGWGGSFAGAGGVFAQTTGSGLAGYFAGNVQVNGTLSKSAGSFKIDHPLDPAHKYLQHSFVESPDMLDVYNGNVTTNARGFATVRLPGYFEALNRKFRYQLTIVGRRGWNARVVSEIADNRFRIQSDAPKAKVSWQVTGVRHDAYANAHRIPVVTEKPAAEQGKYLFPRLYGKPRSLSIMSPPAEGSIGRTSAQARKIDLPRPTGG